MTTIFSGILVALGIAVAAAFLLSETQKPSFDAYTTQSVRIGDPGHNLVGENWNGLSTPSPTEEAAVTQAPSS